MALGVVVAMLLGAPMLYFGILFATRDPVLHSLDRLGVPSWAAQSPEDRIISGSRWCFIDCRLRERTLISERDPAETTEVYQAALRAAGWVRWDVPGCPLVEVDGDYSCWTRDEYTLDLWVRPPDCAYDPLNLRPEVGGSAEEEEDDTAAAGDADADGEGDDGEDATGPQECRGSVVEIKMQNRVADGRGLPAGPVDLPGGDPGAGTASPSPPATPSPATSPPGE